MLLTTIPYYMSSVFGLTYLFYFLRRRNGLHAWRIELEFAIGTKPYGLGDGGQAPSAWPLAARPVSFGANQLNRASRSHPGVRLIAYHEVHSEPVYSNNSMRVLQSQLLVIFGLYLQRYPINSSTVEYVIDEDSRLGNVSTG